MQYLCLCVCACACVCVRVSIFPTNFSVTGGELFDDIVAREFYSEKDAR